MSEPLHPPGYGAPDCWCLQCVFKRIDTKTMPVRATGPYAAVRAEQRPGPKPAAKVRGAADAGEA